MDVTSEAVTSMFESANSWGVVCEEVNLKVSEVSKSYEPALWSSHTMKVNGVNLVMSLKQREDLKTETHIPIDIVLEAENIPKVTRRFKVLLFKVRGHLRFKSSWLVEFDSLTNSKVICQRKHKINLEDVLSHNYLIVIKEVDVHIAFSQYDDEWNPSEYSDMSIIDFPSLVKDGVSNQNGSDYN